MPTDGLHDDEPRAYIRLATLLRQQISAGTLRPGDPAPSITRLSGEYGHARQTCPKALRLLVDEKLLFRVPGLGYFVSRTPRDSELRGCDSSRLTSAMKDLAHRRPVDQHFIVVRDGGPQPRPGGPAST
jgi:GntR family transcriptional regulator